MDYLEESHEMHRKLFFVVEKKKIKKVENLVPNLSNKEKYLVYMSSWSSTESWVDAPESIPSNQIWVKWLAQDLSWSEYKNENTGNQWVSNRPLQAQEQQRFWQKNEKYLQPQRHVTGSKQK